MANQGSRSTTKKKRPASGSSSSGNRPRAKKPSSGKRQSEAQLAMKRNRFVKGVVLLCLSVLSILLYFVEGEKVWLALHQCYHGLFGLFGFMVPVIQVYCAFQLMKEKSTYRFPLKTFFFSGTVVLLASTIYAFSSSGMELEDYGNELINVFRSGAESNGMGVAGGLLGIPFAKLMGAVCGGLVLLLIFAFFLYMSFEVLFIYLIDSLKKPVNDRISDRKEIRSRIREQENIIKNERRQRARREYVDRKVEHHMEAKRRKADNGLRRINKTPIYEPEINSVNTVKTKSIPVEEPAPARSAVRSEPVPAVSSKVKRSRRKSAPEIERSDNDIMEHVSGDSEIFSDTIDIASLLNKPDQSDVVPEDHEPEGFAEWMEEGEASFAVDDAPEIAPPVYSPAAMNTPAQVRHREEKAPTSEEQSAQVAPSEPGEFSGIDTSVIENNYLKPPFTLLEPQPEDSEEDISLELQQNAAKLVDTLRSFGVQATITNICRGPSVTRYELQPASGVKISKITNLADDIAMNLAALGVRIEAPIPGKNAVGIEVPNRNTSIVKMRALLESKEFQNAKSKLTVALGLDITGKITLADLARMPHLLIAGSTGSGKSVCINSMLVSLLYKADPDEVKLMLIDPKVVELGVYNGIPHLLVPVVTDPRKAAGALNWAVNEMLERYKTFAEYNVRDMHGYNRLVDKHNAGADESEAEENERSFEEDEMLAQAQSELNRSVEAPHEIHKLKKMCQIVIVIDELADLMMAAPKEVEESICRLAQMARAAGMHLVIATQRPSVDVITGLIKANVPSRIAFAVKSQIDSRTILDYGGAEKLLGKGDMLFSPIGKTKPVRVQGCFVNDDEIENIISFIKKNKVVEYDKSVIDEIERSSISDSSDSTAEAADGDLDPVMEQAIKCVVEAGQASTSLLQRRLRLGYARAGRLIDEMEQLGIVGPHEGSKPRQVLMSYQQWLERSMSGND